MAIFLDPKFKTFTFSESTVADIVKNRITAEISREIQTHQNEQLTAPIPFVSHLSISSKSYRSSEEFER